MYPATVEYLNRIWIIAKLRWWTWGLLSATNLFLIFMFNLVYFLALVIIGDLFIGLVALFFFFLRNSRSFIYLFIYLWLCWVFVSAWGLSLVVASGDHSSSRCAGLSPSRPLSLRSTSSRRAGSAIVAHGPSCSAARGILPDQGSNLCPLHWQADSQPLRHQGSPLLFLIIFFILINFKNVLNHFIIIIIFLSFFLPFVLSRVADRVLMPWPGVTPEPLRWGSWVQDTGPPETSRPHVLPIGESPPRDLHLNAKSQIHPVASKLQCWMPHAKQLARQEHNPTH